MADEIRPTFSLDVTNGNYRRTIDAVTPLITQATAGEDGGVIEIGTSEEDLDLSNLSTLGCVYLRNLNSTYSVQYGPKSGSAMVVFGYLKPGEIAWLRLYPGITVRLKAETAPVKLQVLALDN